jgi:hypothetical protein
VTPRPPPAPAGGAAPEFADLCVQAVTTAARDLNLDPEMFVEELAQGEIGLLIGYLRETVGHVEEVELRTRVDALLHRLTAWTGAN